MAWIHPSAVIAPEARIGKDVSIGPFAVVGVATIGDGSILHSHVVVGEGVVIGAEVEIFPGALIGKEPKGAGAVARTPVFEKNVLIGDRCSIGPHAVIYYDVEIGSECLIGDGASIREQCRIGSNCIISRYVTINYNTRVGDRVKVMDLTHLTGNMVVEDDAFVSILVGTTNDNIVRSGYGDHVVGPAIGRRVVIGAGATLLPAVKIGDDATVGAAAVVTKNVAEGTKVLGAPARPFSN